MQFNSMTMGAPAASTTRFAGQSYTVPAASVVGGTIAPTTFAPTNYAASSGLPATYVSGAAPATFAPTNYAASSGLPATYVSGAFSTAPRAAQPTMPFGSISMGNVVGQPQMVSSGAFSTFAAQPTMGTVVGQPQMFSTAQPSVIRTAGPVAATYIGGMGVTQASANLVAAGRVVSERVMTLEEYSSGARGVMLAPQRVEVIETVQVVNEVIVDGAGLLEVVQVPEIVETVVVEQPVQFVETLMVEQPVQVEQVFAEQPVEQAGAPRVVIICTSASALGDQPTGAWSEEITAPYYVFTESGCEVYIASILGGQVPIDQGSLTEQFFTNTDAKFQEEGGMSLLENSIAIADVSPEAIDCVWLAGGHGTCMDFEGSLAQFVTDAVAMGRPVGAVCHGVCGLLSAVAQDGTPLLAGKQVTGFSNAEEDAVGLSGVVPFLCQDRMQELGAQYSCDEPWSVYALRDGNIITGQNPQSSTKAAQLCVEAMMPVDMQPES